MQDYNTSHLTYMHFIVEFYFKIAIKYPDHRDDMLKDLFIVRSMWPVVLDLDL